MKKIITMLFAAITMANASADNYKPLTIKNGKIEYCNDVKGNRILDFSFCGYKKSNMPIPEVGTVVFVSHAEGNQHARIQRAIDYVSKQPVDENGFRGAVLLDNGVFEISEPLKISASGVVVRGMSKSGTVLRKTGVDRGAAVYIEGKRDMRVLDTLKITDEYLPVGETKFHAECGNASLLPTDGRHVGKRSEKQQLSKASGNSLRVMVVRPSTKEWIASIRCDVFGGGLGYWGWKPGEMDVCWDRTVSRDAEGTYSLDVPLTVSLDKRWGNSYALCYEWQGRISGCGVENLTIESEVKDLAVNSMSEDHCWDGIYIDAAEDCWVRMVDFKNLAGSAVVVQKGGQQITVEDCCSRNPVSEIGGWRRRTFLTMGGKTLFQRCYSENGINDFSAGYLAPGPNAFVQCDAVACHGYSGSSSSWATGLLFDNVTIEGGGISFKNLELEKWGAGWNTANSVLWQCSASRIDCYTVSDDARNYSIGCWAYCLGDGFWTEVNNHVNPRSLFLTQLSERIEPAAAEKQCRMLMRNLDGSTSPSLQRAAEMAAEALLPRETMEQWISKAVFTASVDPTGIKNIDDIKAEKEKGEKGAQEPPKVVNGKLVIGEELMTGAFHRTPWWNGRPRFSNMAKQKDAITRFVPGYEQRGGTDRIDSVVANIQSQNIAVWNQNYGLWYDRRRDDHERIKRISGDVWPPFFEQSIARSGIGQAWDGLSLYDLSRLNKWYFYRLNKVAAAVPQTIFINQHYFQHNILEAGAHWVDAPWRSANNIQSWGENRGKGTQFLEPVPFTGDKRVFTADLFYDTSNTERAKIYKDYIWNVLDATAENPNIYHSVSEEYTGPQDFVEFWLKTIADWQKARGKKANVVLNATQDVVDAVMENKQMAEVVDVIEIEQWFYHGRKLFAPEGGKNLAPRQHMRLTRIGNPNAADIYRTVRETYEKYPSKAIMYYAKAFDRAPWAVLFAGGSCPSIMISNPALRKELATMRPDCPIDGSYSLKDSNSLDGSNSVDGTTLSGVYTMKGERGSMVYNVSGKDIPAPKGKIFLVNQKDGTVKPLKGNAIANNSIVWIR